MNTEESLAVGEYFSEWPDGLTYEEFMETLNSSDCWGLPEDYVPCEFFEDWYPPALADRIESLRYILEKTYVKD